MGSKQDIIASIALNFPSAENFYDLFGGGFSVTHYMLVNKAHKYNHFHFNELIPSTVELIQKSISGDFHYDKFKPPWVTREDFRENKDTCAYTRLIWSFGNNQKNYLFGSNIEAYKKSLHMAAVFDEFDETVKKVLSINKWPLDVVNVKQKRIYIRQKVSHDGKGGLYCQIESLRSLESLQNLESLERLQNLQSLQNLESLERLQNLQSLRSLQKLTFSSVDYRQVNIKPNSVIYCDIPYKNAGSYLVDFDRKPFFDWAAAQACPVFISEYDVEDARFKLIYTIDKKTKLSPKGLTDGKPEKLYWNGKVKA